MYCLGGEESGGVAIKGHIPERDGIWMGLVIWEYMAKTGKKLDELIQEVYDIVGEFAFERIDLHLEEAKKVEIVENCQEWSLYSFGDMPIVKTETIDGFKFYFDEDSWIMIRPSGTEPVLRTYAEAKNQDKCFRNTQEGTPSSIRLAYNIYHKVRALTRALLFLKLIFSALKGSLLHQQNFLS